MRAYNTRRAKPARMGPSRTLLSAVISRPVAADLVPPDGTLEPLLPVLVEVEVLVDVDAGREELELGCPPPK
jgi:hypothetical protein